MNYKVSDIFYSIQGEGYFTGRPAIFIRLYGCNLSCSFCDEELHKTRFQVFTIDKILASISKFDCKFVVITGGEPSIRDCNPLILALKDRDYWVAVETNGFKHENIEDADWITYSPKNLDDISKIGWDEIKFVINNRTDIEFLYDIPKNSLVWVQPEAFGDAIIDQNVSRCVSIVKKMPHVRLSLQMHKLINIK